MNSTLPYDPDRYRQLRELVDRAAERPAAEWASFLERECPADPALQSEALRLLEHAQAASTEGFLEPSAPPTEPSSVSVAHGEPNPGSAEPIHVGKYQIVRRFSEVGGQAAAYLAFDPDLERHVVLKRYHGGPHGPSGEAEEGRALAKVVSPYVARCHGIERIDGEAYLVVEYVPGRNLAEVRRDGPLDLAQVVRILAQLAEGVAAVHARGLIHRDIKPANVILHDDGTPRLVDFGLTAHLGGSRLRERSGSPPYMAPEQARGEWDRIDFRTDVFGLGGVLYKLLTDHAPHAGSTLNEVLEHAKKADVTPPRQLDPTIPAPVEAVCLKALAAAPENRYTTALEFAAALRQAIEPTPVAPRTWNDVFTRISLRQAIEPTPVAPPESPPGCAGACLRRSLPAGSWRWRSGSGRGARRPRRPSPFPYLRTGCGSAPGRDRGEALQGAGRRPTRRTARNDLGNLAGQRPPAAQGPGAGPGRVLAPGVQLPDCAEPQRNNSALRPGRRYRPQLAAPRAGFPRVPGRLLRPDRRRGSPGVRGGGLRPFLACVRVVEDPGPRRLGLVSGGSRGLLDLRQCRPFRRRAVPRQASR